MSLIFDWNALRYATPEFKGTGGNIREQISDFKVSEVPAYEFSGTGEHTYFELQKQGHNTNHVLKMLSEQLGIPFKDIGVAGLKDRQAITTQWLSVPRAYEERLEQFSHSETAILNITRHSNKLGIGHLQGNVFEIIVRDADFSGVQPIAQRLNIIGIPNYFGPQRFGLQGKNAEAGLEIVRKRYKGNASTHVRRFLVSSLQSVVFNAFVSLRLQHGIFDGLVLGDMAKKHDTGGVFLVEDLDDAQRAKLGLVSATGTLLGRKIKPLTLDAGALEQQILQELGLKIEDFNSRLGDRRYSRVFTDIAAQPIDNGYILKFFLPKGSFATSVLREITKENIDSKDLSDDDSETDQD